MQQKMIIVGVSRRQGVSKKTGNNYDISIVNTLQPQVGTDSNYVAAGFKTVEMQAPQQTVMSALSLGFPCTVIATLSVRNDGKLEIVSMQPEQKSSSQNQPKAVNS